MKRNFTDPSQRAGHIAVGEMYLSRYLFYDKKIIYLCPRMSDEDVLYLDNNKSSSDKEWILLRKEENVFFKTRDSIEYLNEDIKNILIEIQESPLKSGSDAKKKFDYCKENITDNLKSGNYKIK